MQLSIRDTEIEEVKIVIPEVFKDDRGYFMEVYRADQFREFGLPSDFVQFNHSGSVRNTLRGLHFQWDPPMGKLMRVTKGKAYLVAVDIRKGSPTLGKWVGIETTEDNCMMIWAPAGFARGFCVLSEFAEIQYLTTGIYNSNCESGIFWNDPQVGIKWPIEFPILSEKDKNAQTLAQWIESENAGKFSY